MVSISHTPEAEESKWALWRLTTDRPSDEGGEKPTLIEDYYEKSLIMQGKTRQEIDKIMGRTHAISESSIE